MSNGLENCRILGNDANEQVNLHETNLTRPYVNSDGSPNPATLVVEGTIEPEIDFQSDLTSQPPQRGVCLVITTIDSAHKDRAMAGEIAGHIKIDGPCQKCRSEVKAKATIQP